ncbi:MAG TPA: peptidoglycan-binding domain-containing protein [Gammaproteobacteria bacterium]
MSETTETQAIDGRSRAAAELDEDPFGAGPRARRRALRSSILWGFVGLVVIGAAMQGAVVLLRRVDPPPRSFLAQLAPNLTLELKMPRTGRNQTLSLPELRWCMREDIRLEVLETRQAGTETEGFKEAVGTYNARCTRFKYRGNELVVARRDIDAARSWIVAEALAEATDAAEHDDLAAPGYSVLTRDVQELLRALGYAPGPADGRYGPRTQNAVEAFERELGWPSSGRVSELLRKELLERVRSANASEARLFEATAAERSAIRERCSGAGGVSGYNRCVEQRLQQLAEQRPARAISEGEMAAIEETCTRSRTMRGEDAYTRCVAEQTADLGQLGEKPSLAAATDDERAAIEDSCRSSGFFYGPAAYYRCAQERLVAFAATDGHQELAEADTRASSADHR